MMVEAERIESRPTEQVEDEPQITISSRKAYGYLGILWLLFFFNVAVRNVINPLFTAIQSDLGLADGQLGLIGSANLLGNAAFVIPIAYLSGRWSKSKGIGIMAFVWSICAIVSGLATNFGVMIASRIGVGAGDAGYGPAAVSLISSFFPKSKWGKVLGVFNSAFPVALCVGIILAGVLYEIFGWRITLIIIAVPNFFLGFLAFKLPDIKPALKKKAAGATSLKGNFVTTLKLLFSNKSLMVMCLAYGLSYIIISGSLTWLATYFVRYLDYSIAQSTTLTGLMALMGIPAYVFGGFIIDRWYKKDLRSRMWVAAICAVLSAIFSFIGFYFVNISSLFLSLFLAFAAFPVTVSVSSQEVVPFWNKTISFGILTFVATTFAMLGPTLVGYISELSDLRTALTYIQLVAILSALSYTIASITYIRDYRRAREAEQQYNLENAMVKPAEDDAQALTS